MNQGVEILLARMDSNPDEFVGASWPASSKWDWLIDDLRRRVLPTREDKERDYVPLRFLEDVEVQALWKKLELLRADQFTKKVMETLLKEDEEANPFLDAVTAGMQKVSKYQKPTKIIAPAKFQQQLIDTLEKEYNGVFPDLQEESKKQILRDLEALEVARRQKC